MSNTVGGFLFYRIKEGKLLREYGFSYYENKEKKQGKFKYRIRFLMKKKLCCLGILFIDKRSYKIFDVDEKHSLELAQKFFKERYKNYEIKSKDI